MKVLEEVATGNWEGPFPEGMASVLESGKILFAPNLHFELAPDERLFLSPDCLDRKSKNVSYRPATGALKGTAYTGSDREKLKLMLRRYYERSFALIRMLCPEYRARLTAGFTSFRPTEIAGRPASWRKDDTRLHVDAFPSRPLGGLRILRVFTNANPSGSRLWRVGEAFEQLARTFLPRVRPSSRARAQLLYRLHITKALRTPYDQLMIGIHDYMKADDAYQQTCQQTQFSIPPGATWMCFTDSVSHAAMSGQFAFEQTYYLPVDTMRDPFKSPLRILERLTGRALAG
jgi:hypothetical protein